MIRLIEASVLAATKLRTHKIRTAIATTIAGLLFGLIVAIISISQGVFQSIDKFSEVGLNNRAILAIGNSNYDSVFNEYAAINNKEFIAEVEAAHKGLVQKKQAAAKKYSVEYNAESEDPTPIAIDKVTKEKIIKFEAMSSEAVTVAAQARKEASIVPFSIDEYLAPYDSAVQHGTFVSLIPKSGTLAYMKDGKETALSAEAANASALQTENPPSLTKLDQSLSSPFITNTSFDPSKGEIPVIFPISTAEKLIGLTPLSKSAPKSEQLERLVYIREHVGEASTSFCYRNQASIQLQQKAIAQQEELKYANSNPDYVKPTITYALSNDTDCGATTVVTDSRTAAQRKSDENRRLYEQEIGTWVGEPAQQLITVRGVGVASETATGPTAFSVADIIQSLLSSSLGYNTYAIPSDLLAQVPEQYKPADVFSSEYDATKPEYLYQTYLVEFTDKEQARSILEKTGAFGGMPSGTVGAYPFGSGTLIFDELQRIVEQVLVWVLAVVSLIAVIIMTGVIGRAVSDGRRESAVFRAIGASRGDIVRIYGTYTVLLSFRVVVSAFTLGLGLAILVHIGFGQAATIGAQLAYAVADTSITFALFTVQTWYLLALAGAIMIVGILSSIIPIILGSRRSPIRDMRNDM